MAPSSLAPVTGDPPASQVRRITFVPFLADGRCVLIADGLRLPSGEVRPGEDHLLDTVLRAPMETAGFRYQRFHPFGRDGSHLYAWIEGAPYRGTRPHASVALSFCAADEAADRLRAAGSTFLASVVSAAAASHRTQTTASYYADTVRTLERSYLRGDSVFAGSGFGGDAVAWCQARRHVIETIDAEGTFLDVGCANGLLMESVAAWCGELGLRIAPYGVDLAPGLVRLARSRLPHWADRIWLGNAIDWVPPHGLRFDYVHVLLDLVPAASRADLVRHQLTRTVRPGGGRLLVSHYLGGTAGTPEAGEILRALGFSVAGQTGGDARPDRPRAPTAWLVA